MTRPVSGTLILDFIPVLAGPYRSYRSARLGRRRPQRRMSRRRGHAAHAALMPTGGAPHGVFAACRQRQQAKPDARSAEFAAKNIIHRVAVKSAVVMSHLRPGVIERIGLGYAALSAMNPQLVYCAIAGFGQSGTCRNEAG